MKRACPADPFAALELPAHPDVTDDDVRSAWRRIASATHPDRDDGGDPARFAQAAAAYTTLRTRFGRGEALADLASARRARRRWARPRWVAPRWAARGAASRAPLGGRPGPASQPQRGARPRGGTGARQASARLWSRVRRGRPARLALRIVVAAAVSAGAILVAGAQPATPALITGALTWLGLTARHDLAAPDARPGYPR
jgi:curved DNA-binding protein CbpA